MFDTFFKNNVLQLNDNLFAFKTSMGYFYGFKQYLIFVSPTY